MEMVHGMDKRADLDAYAEWLRRRRLTVDQRIPFFINWVRRFLRLQDGRKSGVWRDTLEELLSDLRESGVPAWQIRQADDAVSLYCGQFREEIYRPATHEAPSRTPAEPECMVSEMRRLMSLRHYSPRTEQAYLGWITRFLVYLSQQGIDQPTADDAKAFLSRLATLNGVAASTQNQAFSALLFFFRHVIQTEFDDMASTLRAKRGHRLPVVLSLDETRALLAQLRGQPRLLVEVLYGGGLRVSELVRLRVKDVDTASRRITVRGGKGDKDRVTLLSERVLPQLNEQLERVRSVHQTDLAAGAGEAPLPGALNRKYPNAGREWVCQYLFPSRVLQIDDHGILRRFHISTSAVQKRVKEAAQRAGLAKPTSCHTLRHSFATHLLMQGVDIRRIQQLLGHRNVETTMIYTHVLQSIAGDIRSPLDEL